MLPQRPDSEPTGLLHTVRLELDHFVGDRRRILIFRVEERNGDWYTQWPAPSSG